MSSYEDAETMYNDCVKLFSSGGVENKRKALLGMSSCIEQFPEYTPAYCAIAKAFLAISNPEHLPRTVELAETAYGLDPGDSDVITTFTNSLIWKGSLLWEDGKLEEAYQSFIKAMSIYGFERQSFGAARHLALKLDKLEDFVAVCLRLDMDPEQDVDLSDLGGRE